VSFGRVFKTAYGRLKNQRYRPSMSLITAEEKRLVVNQVKALDQLQQRMFRECHQKCIPKPRDGDLSVAEMSCIDRCVPKYLETHTLVGNEVDNIRRALAAPTVAADNSR
jgi:hypothetical protein